MSDRAIRSGLTSNWPGPRTARASSSPPGQADCAAVATTERHRRGDWTDAIAMDGAQVAVARRPAGLVARCHPSSHPPRPSGPQPGLRRPRGRAAPCTPPSGLCPSRGLAEAGDLPGCVQFDAGPLPVAETERVRTWPSLHATASTVVESSPPLSSTTAGSPVIDAPPPSYYGHLPDVRPTTAWPGSDGD